ncbi:hypothetical protein Hamer_G010353 [Homarus americanus]|uniref:Uncharacterized protein n=1 Tax=Homarus americanus TaxID=6706 RepID=A0A8J5JY50_HOMAM|nr:hypothetical protein Hamer_G010353 [Homarus americanus]
MAPINTKGTVRSDGGENMDRMEEIVEVTCIMSPSRNKNDANKRDKNKPVKNELEIKSCDDENQCKTTAFNGEPQPSTSEPQPTSGEQQLSVPIDSDNKVVAQDPGSDDDEVVADDHGSEER